MFRPSPPALPPKMRASSLPLLVVAALLAPRASHAQYAAGSTAYALAGAVGFQPTSIVVARLVHPAIANRSFSLTAAVVLDEFAAPTDPAAPLVRLQSVALPTATPATPGQYKLTVHGNDLQNIHSLIHGGQVTLAYDGTSVIIAGVDAPVGAQQAAAVGPAISGSWTTNGVASAVATHNMVVGSVDYNGYADISSIAGLAGGGAKGPAGLVYASAAPCTPGHTSCSAGGYVVDTNAYISGYACGPWWVPYNNSQGYTQTSTTVWGTGSFSMYTSCSSTGGGRNLNIVSGQLTYLYYYSSNYLQTLTGAKTWPPARALNSGGTPTSVSFFYLQAIATQAQTGMGFRGWMYVVPIGGCAACPDKTASSVLILLADAGMGLRVMQNAGFNYPSWTINTAGALSQVGVGTNTVDLVGYNKVPNNDQSLIGVMTKTVAGRTIAYVSSATGAIYSFDVSTLTWLNSGKPVFRAGAGSSYRGAVAAPRPLAATGTFCRAPPIDNQTAGGFDAQWPNGYVLSGLTASGAVWGTQSAPVYSSASFGCPAGQFSTSLAVLSCSLSTGWGWGSFTPPTCQTCMAGSGSYCASNGLASAGTPCMAGFFCAGGAASPMPCSAPGGSHCPAGSAQNAAGATGWRPCPAGQSCAGGSALPQPVQPLQANSVMVVRVGDGVTFYGSSTQPVFIDEFDGSTNPMTLIQTIALPVASNGAQQAFSLHPNPAGTGVNPVNGGSVSSGGGFLSLSADGRFLSIAGFAAPPFTPLSALVGPTVPRVIARIDWLGNVDTTTTTVLGDIASTAFSILSACSYDGSGFVFTSDYVSSATGVPALVNYQAFGTQVTDVTKIKTFTSPSQLAQSSAPASPFLGGAQPILSNADGWRQCQYVGNQLVLSHTWSGGTVGDLSAPNIVGAVTDANLTTADFSQRWTWSSVPKSAMGFAHFDNGQHLAICDRK